MDRRPTDVTAGDAGESVDADMELDTILELVRRVVGVADIEPSDRFSAAGGDSLGALRLILDIEDIFGARIPFSALQDDPSALDLVRMLDSVPRVTSDRLLFDLDRRRREGTPVLCLPGVGGSAMRFRHLVSEVARRDLPVRLIGVNYPTRSRLGRMRSLGHVADAIADEVERTLDVPPAIVCGFSWGGFMAPEVAARLASAPLPLILDARIGLKAKLRTLARLAGLCVLGDPGERRRGRPYSEIARETLHRQVLIARYRAKRLTGPVVVVSARSAGSRPSDASDLGWAAVVDGPVHRCTIDVAHGQFLSRDTAGPVAAILAAMLERRWDDLDRGDYLQTVSGNGCA